MTKSDFGARIDLRSFVCHLATTDVSPKKVLKAKDPHFDTGVDFKLKLAGTNWKMLGALPADLYKEAFGQLFHERLHYWQLIGYPLFQWRFVCALELLRHRLFKQNAKTYVVAGLTTGPNVVVGEHIRRAVDILDSPISVAPSSLMEAERVEVTPGRCAMEVGLFEAAPSYMLPHANVLIKCIDGSEARISLDAVHMLESAVSVTEVINGFRELPSDENMRTAEYLHYWGCWVYWREMLSASGLDTERLMYVFLAAIDLAMMGDVGSVLDTDEASMSEDQFTSLNMFQHEFLPGLRFVRICKESRVDLHKVLSTEPFDRITGKNGSDSKSLYELQGLLAEACGMSLPVEVAGRDLLRHTLRLGNFLFMPGGPEAETPGQLAVYALRKVPLEDWRSAIPVCETIWQEIQKRRFEETLEFIGYKVWSVMKNFTESRCRQPAAHVTPTLYFELMRNRFPLPFVNFGGHFYYDWAGMDDEKMLSMHVPGPRVALDLIELLPLLVEPANGTTTACGFIDNGAASCDYAVLGLGCPLIGLTAKQTARRKERKLGNYCHWVFSMKKAGLTQ